MRPSSHRSGGIWVQFKVRLQLAVAVEKIEGRKQTENSLKKVFDVEVGLTATRITPPLQNAIIDIQQVEKIEGRKQTENLLKKVFDVEVGLSSPRNRFSSATGLIY